MPLFPEKIKKLIHTSETSSPPTFLAKYIITRNINSRKTSLMFETNQKSAACKSLKMKVKKSTPKSSRVKNKRFMKRGNRKMGSLREISPFLL
jgi:hypothetical protein